MTETSVILSLLGAISSVFGSHFLSIYEIFQRNTMKTAAGLYIISKACWIGFLWNIVFCILIIKIIILLHVDTIKKHLKI